MNRACKRNLAGDSFWPVIFLAFSVTQSEYLVDDKGHECICSTVVRIPIMFIGFPYVHIFLV